MELKTWSKTCRVWFQTRIEICKRRLADLREEDGRWNGADFQKIKEVLIDLLQRRHIFWQQCAKTFWLTECDRNTKFFHNAVRQHRRKNKMKGLRLPNGAGKWIALK
ncbi:unnamed protein product [Cuscuta europaea]|uniref:Uncharacterized protein n=1 Tax=Cuscuta europaea TaxID=41803 RepID=A0A9P1DWP9_CUSEU|nr:unnamed protein product [Cuscuta europaea]